MKLYFLSYFLFILLNNNYIYSQIAIGSKIYLHKKDYFIPFVEDRFKAMTYKGNIEAGVNDNYPAFVLWIALSNRYGYKIKYSITESNYLIAFSLYSDSLKIDGRFISQKTPSLVTIKLSELEDTGKESIRNFLNNNSITGPDIQSLSLLDNLPMKQYVNEKVKTNLIFHDFASSSQALYLTNKIIDTLKVWKYETSNENLQLTNNSSLSESQRKLPQLINSYEWTLEENFYTCYIKNQLFLFTESGYIFRLGETAEKLGQLPDNLIDSAIVVDKDHDRLYLLKKSHIEEGLTFAEMLKKYAQEIKLPEK